MHCSRKVTDITQGQSAAWAPEAKVIVVEITDAELGSTSGLARR
jgi:hypothetical protein